MGRVNWIGGLSNHAPRMVSGILGGEGVVGKPLIKFHDCVMGLMSACGAICVSSVGPGAGDGAETLAGMLWTVEPAVWRRVSKALLIGVCSTRCWRGGLMEGVTGGAAGGSCAEYGAGGGGAFALALASCCSACSRSALVQGSSSQFGSGVSHGWVGVAGAGAGGASTQMTTGLGGVTVRLGVLCRWGVEVLVLRGCSLLRLARLLGAVTIMSPYVSGCGIGACQRNLW